MRIPALTLIVACTAVAVSIPAAAEASRSCGALTVRGGVITLTATSIRTYNHLSCARGRQVVRAYFRRQLSDFDGCTVPAKNPPFDGCAVLSYTCTTKGNRSLAGRCEGPEDRVVRFNERDASAG
jgi:hypothetical protein